MSKANILICWIGGLIFEVLAAIMLVQLRLADLTPPYTAQSPIIVPAVLLWIGMFINLVSFIGALVLAGRLGAWGWFVVVLLLEQLGVLIFLIFGPSEFTYDNDYSAYDDPYDPYSHYSR